MRFEKSTRGGFEKRAEYIDDVDTEDYYSSQEYHYANKFQCGSSLEEKALLELIVWRSFYPTFMVV